MRILTDAPDAARALLARGAYWRRADGDGVDAEARALWADLGAGGAPWFADGGPPVADGVAPVAAAASAVEGVADDRWLVIVDDAPRSQFDHLNERLSAGHDLPDGLACVALAGSRFRGQRGRPWTALRGNLHLSVHLALDLDAAAAQVGLTLLPAVATARAVESVSDGRLRPGLKWINDLLLAQRKVAGVLTSTQLQGGRIRHAVFGIGVNVARAPELPPSPRAAAAGSLAALDALFAGEAAWARLLPALLAELERGRRALVAGDGAALFDAYRERAAFLGRDVTIWPVDEGEVPDAVAPLARGRVLRLLPDLSLELEGRAAPVRVGRMTIDP
jgi:biotin-[acetyl-CoA-carboxylase] ligase BirA-like protein